MSKHVQRLKYLREKNHKTQECIAKFLKVSRTTISKYECGLREPDIYAIKALASYYKVSVDYLLGLSDIENSEKENRISENQRFIEACDPITDDMRETFQDKALMNLAAKIRENELDTETIDNILNALIALKKRS